MASSEFKLHSCPDDGITRVRFGPSGSQFLIASSWDGTVRLYDVQSNCLRVQYGHSQGVLDCVFQDPIHVWSGGLDGHLKLFDINSRTELVTGQHEKPIRCIEYCDEVGQVVSGGWDGVVKLWDPRSGNRCIGSYTQPEKVYSMSLATTTLVVATAGRKIWVWDLRNMGHVQQKRESSLKFQTRYIECFPNNEGYVCSSIEGRVAVEYLDPSPEVQRKKYAFKCHRNKESGIEVIYPISAISFHRQYNTFATGGADGLVNIWDGHNKKRLCQLRKYPTSIASLCFSKDGKTLAIASSYIYEQGYMPSDKPEDAIYIRQVTDQETKPK